MNKKWLFLLLLAIGASLLLTSSPAAAPPIKEPIQIGFINISNQRIFSTSIQSHFQELTKNDLRFQVRYYDGEDDARLQNQYIHELIGQGAKAIVLIAANANAVFPGIQEANEAGVPIITLNVRSFSGSSTYVGPLEYDAGWKQGEFMLSQLSPGAKIIYISGPHDVSSAQQRLQGFLDSCILPRPDLQLAAFGEVPYSDREVANRLMQDWLRQGIIPDAVVAASDEMAIGAFEAIRSAGLQKTILISGINASQEACQLVKEGALAQTIHQDALKEAQGAYSVINHLLQQKSGTPPKDIIVPFTSVTKENVAAYLDN